MDPDDLLIAVLIGYEVVSIVTPLPTISTAVRRLPAPIRWAVAVGLGALFTYHLVPGSQ